MLEAGASVPILPARTGKTQVSDLPQIAEPVLTEGKKAMTQQIRKVLQELGHLQEVPPTPSYGALGRKT